MNSINDIINEGKNILHKSGFSPPSAIKEARYILSHILKCDISYLIANDKSHIQMRAERKFIDAIHARARHTPFAYIIGGKEFYGHIFSCGADTLIPRPDSEILVEMTENIYFKSSHFLKAPRLKMLDICCGTGCIGISLYHALYSYVKNHDKFHIDFADISARALVYARRNFRTLISDYPDNTPPHFVKSDWCSKFSHQEKYHIMVANPPYITTDDMQILPRTVRQFEPHIALHGGDDGLESYKILAAKSKNHLYDKGVICLEIGAGQLSAVRNIFNAENWTPLIHRNDLSGIVRAIAFQWQG